jgi:hypothetical protein
MPEVPLPTQNFPQGPTKFTATEIQAMVCNMDQSKLQHQNLKIPNPDKYFELLKTENATLFEEFPAIFALHADNKLDETFFYMLNEKRKIEKGSTTEDEASVRVGQKLFQKWVAPVVSGTPSPQTMTYEEYYKSMNK